MKPRWRKWVAGSHIWRIDFVPLPSFLPLCSPSILPPLSSLPDHLSVPSYLASHDILPCFEPGATESRKHGLELLKPWTKINFSSLQGDTTQVFCQSVRKLMNTVSSTGRLLLLSNNIVKQCKLFKCFYQILKGFKHTISSSVHFEVFPNNQ